MQIFVENIEDDILFLTFYCFSWWISIFEVNGCLPFTRKNRLVESCSKWDASNLERKFPWECARTISTTGNYRANLERGCDSRWRKRCCGKRKSFIMCVAFHTKNHSQKAYSTPITHQSGARGQQYTHEIQEGTFQVQAGHMLNIETFAKPSL